MDLLKTPKMRLAQLQSFTQSTINIVQGQTEVEAEITQVNTAFTPFKESMINVDASSDKKALDKTRDTLISGLVQDTQAEQKFPHEDDTTVSTLKQFSDIVYKYGYNLAYLPYDDESAETDNLLAELKNLDLTPLSTTGLQRWIPVIENANNAFKARTDEYIEETAAADELKAASKLAQPLIDALNNLLIMLFSQANAIKSEALLTAHSEMEKLVDSYR